jgi:hypothetical protein
VFEAVRQRACDILSDSGVQHCTIQSVPLLPLEALSVAQVRAALDPLQRNIQPRQTPLNSTAHRFSVPQHITIKCMDAAGAATRGVHQTSEWNAVSLDSAVGRLKGCACTALFFDRCEIHRSLGSAARWLDKYSSLEPSCGSLCHKSTCEHMSHVLTCVKLW